MGGVTQLYDRLSAIVADLDYKDRLITVSLENGRVIVSLRHETQDADDPRHAITLDWRFPVNAELATATTQQLVEIILGSVMQTELHEAMEHFRWCEQKFRDPHDAAHGLPPPHCHYRPLQSAFLDRIGLRIDG